MNVEELFKEWKSDNKSKHLSIMCKGWDTNGLHSLMRFCIEKERERCISILEKYQESDVSAQNELVWTALTFVWHEIKVEP